MQFDKLAFVDIETTGGSPQFDRVIEIGVLRVENGKLKKKFKTLIDPGCTISPWIERITGIKQDDVDGAPSFYDVHEELFEILEGCTFVAHNVRFDYGFLKEEFARLGVKYSSPHFCTVKLSRALYPEQGRHNLDAVIAAHNLECENRHRAFDDAKVLWDFYKISVKKFGQEKIAEALQKISKKVTLPIHLDESKIKKLPRTPGVYIFYGENRMPLYVGKSVNLRARVMSHFTGDIHASKEMKISQQITDIEVIETSSELGALFKESDLVKKLQPLYNRQLRHARELIVLRSATDQQGYLNNYFDLAGQIEVSEMDKIVATFKSKKQGIGLLTKLAKEHSLCKKLLGLEKTNRHCFAYNLGRCKGACIGEEKPELYNIRVEMAFSKFKIQRWPYELPIVITDGHDEENESFLIDKWCYLGKLSQLDGAALQREVEFDQDIYKIIRRFINNPSNSGKIKTFSGNLPEFAS